MGEGVISLSVLIIFEHIKKNVLHKTVEETKLLYAIFSHFTDSDNVFESPSQ